MKHALGHSLMVEHRTLTPLVLVRIQLPQPVIEKHTQRVYFLLPGQLDRPEQSAWPIRRRTINNHSKTDMFNRVFVYGWFIVCQGRAAPTKVSKLAHRGKFLFVF